MAEKLVLIDDLKSHFRLLESCFQDMLDDNTFTVELSIEKDGIRVYMEPGGQLLKTESWDKLKEDADMVPEAYPEIIPPLEDFLKWMKDHDYVKNLSVTGE